MAIMQSGPVAPLTRGARRASLACRAGAALWAIALALAGSCALARDADRIAIEELLRSARLWQNLENPENERHVLRKILAVDDEEPRALFLLGEVEYRSGNRDQARRLLERLSRVHGSASGAGELRRIDEIYAHGKARLDQLRLAVRGGETDRALSIAHALFPDGRPPGDFANEFAGLLSHTDRGWRAMRAYLQERIAADPNARDRLTLYELLAQREDTRPEALQGFAELTRAHDASQERIAKAWRLALAPLPEDDLGVAEWRRYVENFPRDAQARAELARIEAARLEEERLANDPAVLARLAAAHELDAGELTGAEKLLQESLALRADDGETVGTLGLLRLKQGRNAEALAQFERAIEIERKQPAHSARWIDLAATARYWDLLQQARALRDAADLAGAVQLARQAQPLQPGQTEASQLLATLYLSQGSVEAALDTYRTLLQRDGTDRRAWRGLLSGWLKQGRVDAALDQAQELSAAGIPASEVLDAGALRDAIAVGERKSDERVRLLEAGVALVPRDPWLRYDLARAYLRLGLPSLAIQVVDDGARLAPDDASLRYAQALVEESADRDDRALATVDAIPDKERSAGIRETAQRLRFERDLRAARVARAAGRAREDADWRTQALGEAGEDASRRLRVAQADIYAGDVNGARRLLDPLDAGAAALSPGERRALAGAMIDTGDPARALQRIDDPGWKVAGTDDDPKAALDTAMLRARAHHALQDAGALNADLAKVHDLMPPEDVARHIEAIDLMDGDPKLAHAWLDDLRKAHPKDPQVLVAAARQARRERRYADAVQLLKEAISQRGMVGGASTGAIPVLAQGATSPGAPGEAPTTTGAPDAAHEELARIEGRRQPQVDTGILRYSRSAADGMSSLHGSEIPVLGYWPGGYDGHWFAQVDSVHLDAGVLPADFAGASDFGKVQALAPGGLAQPLAQTASGLSFAGGWRGDERRFDLGVVGLGFKVSNIVGGARQDAQWNGTDVRIEGWRRIQTGSLLAYAGAQDPVTGASWGGVVDNAILLRAARDFADRWSGSTSLSAGVLTGRSVLANARIQSRTALDRDWIVRPGFRLSAGGVLSLWHYQHNQSFYSFGQGGYYSPQRYVSLGVQVEATGRQANWSYDLRLMPARSWTYEQNVPYYPTDANLQIVSGNPIHTAGPGGGPSASVHAVAEYRAAEHWSLGASLDIDRSAYYAPTQAMLYLRYWFEPQLAPVEFPPHAVAPISQY